MRKRNFNVNTKSLELVIPEMFIMDHANYSRWLPVSMQSFPFILIFMNSLNQDILLSKETND